jgi:hypothetical protein
VVSFARDEVFVTRELPCCIRGDINNLYSLLQEIRRVVESKENQNK